jgi:hypothetical protein
VKENVTRDIFLLAFFCVFMRFSAFLSLKPLTYFSKVLENVSNALNDFDSNLIFASVVSFSNSESQKLKINNFYGFGWSFAKLFKIILRSKSK